MALNFTQQYGEAKKKNPNLSLADFQKQYQAQSPENADAYKAAAEKNKQLAQTNQQRAQDAYIKSGGTLKEGEVFDKYATLRGMAEQRAQGVENPKAQATYTAEQANKLRTQANQQELQYQPATQDYNLPIPGKQQADLSPALGTQEKPQSELDLLREQLANQQAQTQIYKQESQARMKEIGQVSNQVSDFGQQLQAQQSQVQDLVNALNTKQQGLGDHVNSVLQDMAASGVQANLTPESLKMIQDMAENTPPDQLQQLDQKISQISQPQQAPEQAQAPQPAVQPQELPPPPAQQYQSLKSSGMSAAQILQQNPNLSKEIVPDGSILNTNTGVNIVQTALGESYKTPSGLLIPKDSSTGFYNLSSLTPDQITKMSFADLMSIDLATQKTSADMKAFYSAQTFQQMSQRNDREYGIAQQDLQSYYNAQSNRLDEAKLKDAQDLELERMRQELSKDTSIQQLNDSKSKAANMMKAQMDAWGLEGSSVMVTSMIAQSNKFEQEISNVKKSYDINIMELTMASTQSQMQYVNRITELNQDMQGKKMNLRNEYLNRKDEIDNSLLLSKIAQKEEKDNAYRDYVAKIYDNEQQSQAAAAEAAKAAQDDLWEKQKYYTEQMGVMVSVGPDGSINPLLDDEGNPVQTMEGQKFQWEQTKYSTDYDLRLQQFQQDQYEFGIDANLRQAQFQQNVQEFGMDYALRQDKQYFDQNMDQMKFNQSNEQFYAQMAGYDIKVDENGDYIGTNKMGQVVNFGNGINVAVPNKSKYEYNVVGSDEIRFNAPEGQPLPNGRTQCGQFVNDALFGGPQNGGVGDSFESKMKLNNSPGTPVAGGAFFENIPGLWTGHTGLVEKVYPDGSFDIRESNYKKNAQGTPIVSTAHIVPGSKRWTYMVENGGFYDPIKGGSGVSKKGGGVTAGGDYGKYYQEAKAQGMPDQEAKAYAVKQFNSQNAPLTQAQSSALDALTVAKRENNKYNSIISKMDPVKFADAINIVNRQIANPDAPLTSEAINKLKISDDARQAIYSETRWIQALLRKESGAAISAGEYATYGNQYFPRKGDDAQTIKDKAEARSLKEATLEQQVGPAGMKAYENIQNTMGTTQSSFSSIPQKSNQFSIQSALKQGIKSTFNPLGALADTIFGKNGYSIPEEKTTTSNY